MITEYIITSNLELVKSRHPIFNGIVFLRAIHKWRHLLRGEGGSSKRWRYSINLFSRMGDKGEGGVKNLKKWVASFMDNRRRHTATLVCGKCSTGHWTKQWDLITLKTHLGENGDVIRRHQMSSILQIFANKFISF